MNDNKTLLRFDVFLVVITALYSILVIAGLSFYAPLGGSGGSEGNIATNTLGLFVPIGPSNGLMFLFFGLAALLEPTANPVVLASTYGPFIIALLLFVGALFCGEPMLRRLQLSPGKKVAANLIVLLLLTLCIDMLSLRGWASMGIMLRSAGVEDARLPRLFQPNLPSNTSADQVPL